MTWDLFISHASEDKDEVARPLAQLLESEGLSVWLDEHELVLGDNLRRKVDEGLSQSKWGIVVLSPHFLRKTWTQAELDALVSREENGVKVILPVWHRVSHEELLAKSPLLAARLGISTSEGIEAVCHAVLRAIGRRKGSDGQEIFETDHTHNFLDVLSQFAGMKLWLTGEHWDRPEHDTLSEIKKDIAAESRQLIGQQVGRYFLKEFVGLGGTGLVFHAIHLPVGTPVALKLFYPLKENFSSLTRATERAVRGLMALHHRGIARLIDFGYFSRSNEVTAYLACEFVRGKSLDQWSRDIATEADAPLRRLGAAIEIAETLQAVHACKYVGDLGFQEIGVLHGDIKPANIIVRSSDDQPKILDFMEPDLQRLLAGSDQNYTDWKKRENGSYWYDIPVSTLFGTRGYMPPEQAVDGTVLPASDVYALGITFGELFSPFRQYVVPIPPWSRVPVEPKLPTRRIPMHAKIQDSLMKEKIGPLIQGMTMAHPQERIQNMNMVVTELKRIDKEIRKREVDSLGHHSKLGERRNT